MLSEIRNSYYDGIEYWKIFLKLENFRTKKSFVEIRKKFKNKKLKVRKCLIGECAHN